MAGSWERYLDRWTNAGLIEKAAADRVRSYETEQEKARGLRWPVRIAIAFGAILFAAGILLFVAAHWDKLSPPQRFALVLVLVALMHLAGAFSATRFSILSTALHAVGTVCLGAGIYLTGQIFHLEEHWPAGMLLWALGASAAWVLLRDWVQAGIAVILIPVWLAGEWAVATDGIPSALNVLGAGVLSLAITYFSAVVTENVSAVRRTLRWIGGIVLIPAAVFIIRFGSFNYSGRDGLPWVCWIIGWSAALLLPLGFAWCLRRKRVLPNIIAVLWVVALSLTAVRISPGYASSLDDLPLYILCAIGSIGLITWGMLEDRKERVNLGILGFALTVLFFYFSTIMDKLGRSASLIGLGFLFLLGGWFLEKARRRLIDRMETRKGGDL